MLLLIRKGLLRILTQLRRIARLLGETRDGSGLSQDTGRRDKEYGRSVGWRDKKEIKISNLTLLSGKKMVILARELLRTTMLN